MLSHFSHVQLCVTPQIINLPGSPVHGILQARILKWVTMPSSRESSRFRDRPATPALQTSSLPLSQKCSVLLVCFYFGFDFVFASSPLWKHLHLLILQETFTLVFNYSPGSVHLPNFYKPLNN